MGDRHTQCLLERGTERQVTWIPSAFAVEGKLLRLCRRGDDSWDDGWIVKEAWTTMASDEVNERSQDHKKQRQASDRPRDGGRERLSDRVRKR